MKKSGIFLILALLLASCVSEECNTPRQITQLSKGWQFINEEVENGEKPKLSTDGWETVTVPHDWAISGEFDQTIDVQKIMVVEDGEKVPKLRTGRTGGLPHVGIGWYRKEIAISSSKKGKRIFVEFDGAMSNAKVFLNGNYVGEWPYGYASFGFDITDFVKFGKKNLLAVRLENKPNSARWYPGAGLYRNVRLVVTEPVFVKQWGTYLTTPDIQEGIGTVNLKSTIVNKSESGNSVRVMTEILNSNNEVLATVSDDVIFAGELILEQSVLVNNPELWSVKSPTLYTAKTTIWNGEKQLDSYNTPFGFRYSEFTNNNGFLLNGERVPLNGVCLHHDLGPLGAAVNLSSLRHRMTMLQEMGCNSIRTSHNPPTPEMLDLADEMGFLIIDEAFDEWKMAKCENGYNKLWDEWAEKDMVAFIHRDRNHPSVIMWSVGNEIREQNSKDGAQYCQLLVDICKKEDPTRPTTAGFNQWDKAIKYGFADIVDVPGWNYKPQHYNFIHKKFPHWKMYASETASTVSSRGEYFLPAKEKVHYQRVPYHSSSYDNEFPRWATSADEEFKAQDECEFIAGEYVWTGFDYLGEPTPYNVEWPSRSSYFGIIDLCGIPKDRFFLYQSKWTDKEVLHLLPHWNWKKGENVSVHCYTNYDRGELFLNGKSLGIKEKDPSKRYTTYRLVWDDVAFESGELKVVALGKDNKPLKEAFMVTAEEPANIVLVSDRDEITADGKELAFITAVVVDKNGVTCPRATNLIHFDVMGNGRMKAVGNGDPTSLESFVEPYRKAFNGKCMAIAQSTEEAGSFTLIASSDDLDSKKITITTVE
jgi:beta-galactosidase